MNVFAEDFIEKDRQIMATRNRSKRRQFRRVCNRAGRII
jgi:hypothetical protein